MMKFLILAIFLLMMPATSYAQISNTNELIAAMQLLALRPASIQTLTTWDTE